MSSDFSASLSPLLEHWRYASALTQYQRRQTIEVAIGDVPLGGNNPIRVQSMTTVDTMDTLGSVEQAIRMIEAGCEYVRITAPSLKEAQNLENIKKELRKRGYNTPLVADIHFTPNAAELAARIVEKVRVNPGNYADKKRFEVIEYTDAQYQEELERIREKFVPLIRICKEYGTAMRIGTNHGSLSDRITSRYGDNPAGMVESALEFIRICEDEGYYNLVVSMKSSNTQVMVQAYRLLVNKLDAEGLKPYPLHLGVTEAGEAEDGRIKSAVGIGTLLADGLGDTVRVSLTEEPEFEIPVGRKLVARYASEPSYRQPVAIPLAEAEAPFKNPFAYQKRPTYEVFNLGKDNVPRVMTDFSAIKDIAMADFKSFGYSYLPALDKWGSNDTAADFVYLGDTQVPFMMPNGLKAVCRHETAWMAEDDSMWSYPLFEQSDIFYPYPKSFAGGDEGLNFIRLDAADVYNDEVWEAFNKKGFLKKSATDADAKNFVIILSTQQPNALQTLRNAIQHLMRKDIQIPVLIHRTYSHTLDAESLQLQAATDMGGLLIDGLGDGVMLSLDKYSDDKAEALEQVKMLNALSFGILQAARTRMTKTEYISCPSCGRTLFDLQETTAMIRKRTDHLKGVKIGIMGCIVNGPGEMADADYGYVGSGKDKITLYRGMNVVKRAVPSDKAVDELIALIREDGKWIERPSETPEEA
ncbi:(E)-4-hydroxy-3-methylbut-2-enyl-diphosphate synthase [Eisenibacter elegans]|jgi:(E)-4-hydroxy-3-methylbut-2-enyl-diphosphate synthase|uniref:(E)-4-hydroxy-3-methylbut-2-enyl-diphosphate synthase n=1 Tax=Eisenibacter elegans TaxID=997 RepID=UPI000688E421|nr:(E)-4-hydroxy-3-methylbut-2-enyl-diphosphate synthase [Eisenibacter elegans]